MTKHLLNTLRVLSLSLASLLFSAAALGQTFGPVIYLHADLRGNVIAATDQAAIKLWDEGYEPYGSRKFAPAAAQTQSYGFHGKARDADTGLSYFGGRYYNPLTARFTGVDVVGVQEGNIHSFNRYAFANNNPYKYTDPDGRQATSDNPLIDMMTAPVFIIGCAFYSDCRQSFVNGFRAFSNEASRIFNEADKATSGKSCPNPAGWNGKQDHKDKVKELAGKAEGELQEGESVLEGKKIRGHDSNRRPDVQIVDVEGCAIKCFEAERHPNRARNRAREAEYDELGVEQETHGLSE
jgi:RHS repeat-associated protein